MIEFSRITEEQKGSVNDDIHKRTTVLSNIDKQSRSLGRLPHLSAIPILEKSFAAFGHVIDIGTLFDRIMNCLIVFAGISLFLSKFFHTLSFRLWEDFVSFL